jgi:hypothetical protein
MVWKHRLFFLASALTTVISGFLIVMHFQHNPHWPAERFGGTPGALALIPVCLLSYGVGGCYINRWLHPKVFPRLRAALPAPASQPPGRARTGARSIALSALVGTLSGAVAIVHFSQPLAADSSLPSTLAALLCTVTCFISFGRCSLFVEQWLRARSARLVTRTYRLLR